MDIIIPTKKDAAKRAIQWLKEHEPRCVCEQCEFGYRFDEDSKNKCKQERLEYKKDHEKWEQKMLKWKTILEEED